MFSARCPQCDGICRAAVARVGLRPDRGEQHLERRDAELQRQRAIAVVGMEPVVARFQDQAGRDQDRFVAGAADLEEDAALVLELDFLVVELARPHHAAIDVDESVPIEALERPAVGGAGRRRRPAGAGSVAVDAAAVDDGGLHSDRRIIASGLDGISSSAMAAKGVRLHRWDEIALEKVTEMLSRKIVAGEREMLVQVYVKRGCLVPMHAHESEQMTYVLQGALEVRRRRRGDHRARRRSAAHSRQASSIRPKRSRTPSSSTCSARFAASGSTASTTIGTSRRRLTGGV